MSQQEPAEDIRGESAEAASSGEPESIERRLEETKADADRYLANWQRAQADFVNYKRRVETERQEAGRLSIAALVINLLPVMDDLERALASVDARLAGLTWVDGIRLIHRKFQAVMEASGVKEIPAEGQQFDPNVHEAVMFEDGEEGRIIRELQRGYRLGDRVIRPSMVIVGKSMEEQGKGRAKSEGSA